MAIAIVSTVLVIGGGTHLVVSSGELANLRGSSTHTAQSSSTAARLALLRASIVKLYGGRVAPLAVAVERAPPALAERWTKFHPFLAPKAHKGRCRCTTKTWDALTGCTGWSAASAPFCVLDSTADPTQCARSALFPGAHSKGLNVRCGIDALRNASPVSATLRTIPAAVLSGGVQGIRPKWGATQDARREPADANACRCIHNEGTVHISEGWSAGERVHWSGCNLLWSIPQDPHPKCATTAACPYASFGDQYEEEHGIFNSAIGIDYPGPWVHCASPLWAWPKPPAFLTLQERAVAASDSTLVLQYAHSASARKASHDGAPVRHLPTFAPPMPRMNAAIRGNAKGSPHHYVYQTDCLVDGLATDLFVVGLEAWQIAWRLNAHLVWNQQHFVSENTPQLRSGFRVLHAFDLGMGDTFHGLGWGAFPPSAPNGMTAATLFDQIARKELKPLYISNEFTDDVFHDLVAELSESQTERAIILQRCADFAKDSGTADQLRIQTGKRSDVGQEAPAAWLRRVFHAARRVLRPVHPIYDLASRWEKGGNDPSAWAGDFVVTLMLRFGDVSKRSKSGKIWSRGLQIGEGTGEQFETPQESNLNMYIAVLEQLFRSGLGDFSCASARVVVVSQGRAEDFEGALNPVLARLCPLESMAAHRIAMELDTPAHVADKDVSARGLWRSIDTIVTSDVIVMLNQGSSFGKFAVMLADPATIKVVGGSSDEVQVLDNRVCSVVPVRLVGEPMGAINDFDGFGLAWEARMRKTTCHPRFPPGSEEAYDPPPIALDLHDQRAQWLVEEIDSELMGHAGASVSHSVAALAESVRRSFRDVSEAVQTMKDVCGWIAPSLATAPLVAVGHGTMEECLAEWDATRGIATVQSLSSKYMKEMEREARG